MTAATRIDDPQPSCHAKGRMHRYLGPFCMWCDRPRPDPDPWRRAIGPGDYGFRDVPPVFAEHMRGLFVGGCVERGVGSSFRAQAHAHTATTDQWRGWACVRSPRRLWTAKGDPSRLMWHEYVHLETGHGHDDTWRAAMRRHGQPILAHYRKKAR